ncbi:MAG: M67 family metallopeptidase [Eubacterium sp.]|nr:M67 family metallopeptidase [Eubacterium sp.]
MIVYLREQDYDELIRYCRQQLPLEACGILAGNEEGLVEKVYEMKNQDESPRHFSLDTGEQIAVRKDMRERGYRLIAYFHSHPEAPARMSEEDKRLAEEQSVHCIVSFENEDKAVMNAFQIDEQKNVKNVEWKLIGDV